MATVDKDETGAAAGVSVNGVQISEAAIAREVQYHPAPSLDSARAQATRALVIRELLLQQAAHVDIVRPGNGPAEGDTETDEEHLIQTLMEQEIDTPVADERACRTYYQNNLQRFHTTPLYQAAHILFTAAPADLAAREAARQLAEATLTKLQAEPERFASLAKEYSACSSGQQGGSLGQIEAGQTVTEFERQLAHMVVGEICPRLVETRFGFHIVRLDHRIEGRQLPFEAVREQITDYLEESVRRRAISQYLHQLLGAAEIVGIDLAADASPLMQ